MFLKQSTNTIIPYGPFVASADGDTAQTSLTINQADIIIRKHGGNTWAQKAATGGATAVASGMYAVNIGTGDSNTVGLLDLLTHVSPALYVKQSYIVLPGPVYDSLIGGTDFLQTDSHQASGTNILTLLDNAISSRVAATAAVFDKVDVNVSSRFAATATEVGRIDVNSSSRLAATAAVLNMIDVSGSSRVAATAATWGNLDTTVSSVYTKASGAATELGVGNIDVKISSRLAATATEVGRIDVGLSSRMAATGALTTLVSAVHATATQVTDKTGYTAAVSDKTGFELVAAYDLAKTAAQASAVESVLQKTDVTTSSRLAATATEVGRIDVTVSSRLAATATEVGRIDVTLSTRAASAVLATVSASAVDVWDFSRGNKNMDITGNGFTAFKSDGTTILWSYTMSGANPASAVPAYIKSTRN